MRNSYVRPDYGFARQLARSFMVSAATTVGIMAGWVLFDQAATKIETRKKISLRPIN